MVCVNACHEQVAFQRKADWNYRFTCVWTVIYSDLLQLAPPSTFTFNCIINHHTYCLHLPWALTTLHASVPLFCSEVEVFI